MKKVLSLFLSFVMLMNITAGIDLTAYADVITSGDYECYCLGDGIVEISGYNGNTTDLQIPSVIDGYDVISIGYSAFENCTCLKNVTIPDSVTSIDSQAFSGCTGLTSITIPNSVTSIGSNAFFGCTGLTGITIPNSVTSIGPRAFSGCTSLAGITIPNSVTYISESTFCDCESLASVIIPDSVTGIGSEAFGSCSSLENIIIPDSVKGIGWGAFFACISLRFAKISSNITSISDSLFANCYNLESVTIPDSVTIIRDDAFCGCHGLKSITINNNLTEIRSHAFQGCDVLRDVYYDGSKSEWKKIVISSTENNDLKGAIIHCIDGTLNCRHKLADSVCQNCGYVAEIIYEGETKTTENVYGGEYKFFTFVPEKSGIYKFSSAKNSYTEGWIYNADMKNLAYDHSISDSNFSISYNLKAGEVYYLGALVGSYIESPVTLTVTLEWIQTNNVERIEFITVKPYVFEEYTNGIWQTDYDTGEEYYYYYMPSINDGDILKVYYTDDSSEQIVFDSKKCEYIKGNIFYYYNYPDTSEYITLLRQEINPESWGIGTNYFEIDYEGAKVNVPVKIGNSKWIKSGNRWWYQHADDSYTKNAWELIDSKWYHFDNAGWMQTGWIKTNSKWYYLSSSGAMVTGWQKVNNAWYYMNASGAMTIGWQKVSNKWYYMNSSGVMQTGWVKVSGQWYYLNSSGVMQTGWIKLNNKWYYLNSSGVMLTGKQKIENKWYNFNSNGEWIQ